MSPLGGVTHIMSCTILTNYYNTIDAWPVNWQKKQEYPNPQGAVWISPWNILSSENMHNKQKSEVDCDNIRVDCQRFCSKHFMPLILPSRLGNLALSFHTGITLRNRRLRHRYSVLVRPGPMRRDVSLYVYPSMVLIATIGSVQLKWSCHMEV